MDAIELNKLTLGHNMDERSATEVVGWAAETFGKGLVLSCGFAADDMVLLDMWHRTGAKPSIFIVDSGRLFPETYEFMDAVIDKYNPHFSFFFPNPENLKSYLISNGPNSFRHDHKLRLTCCEIRRQEPLKRAIDGYNAWMAGLRRSQGPMRQNIHKVAMDQIHPKIAKICPLADWSWEQVWTYAKEHSVPMHPLYDQGFMSIGCAPCTRPSPSGDERAGRWWWEPAELREDGMHFTF